jgi:hypothetical protein
VTLSHKCGPTFVSPSNHSSKRRSNPCVPPCCQVSWSVSNSHCTQCRFRYDSTCRTRRVHSHRYECYWGCTCAYIHVRADCVGPLGVQSLPLRGRLEVWMHSLSQMSCPLSRPSNTPFLHPLTLALNITGMAQVADSLAHAPGINGCRLGELVAK